MPQLNFGEVYGVVAAAMGGFGILALTLVYAAIDRDVREAAAVGALRMEARHAVLPGVVTAYCLFMPLVTTLYAATGEQVARLLTVLSADAIGLTCAVYLFKHRDILFVTRIPIWIVLALVAVFTAVATYSLVKRPSSWELLSLCILILGLAGGGAVCIDSIENSALLPLSLNKERICLMKQEFAAQDKEHGQLCSSHGLNRENSPRVAELRAMASMIYKGPHADDENHAVPLEQLKQWKNDIERCKAAMAAHASELKS